MVAIRSSRLMALFIGLLRRPRGPRMAWWLAGNSARIIHAVCMKFEAKDALGTIGSVTHSCSHSCCFREFKDGKISVEEIATDYR